SKADELIRVAKDLRFLFRLLNLSPLGAYAVSGAPEVDGIGVDRQLTARLLGFEGVIDNTIDAISSRGELALRFLYVLNSLMVLYLSRLCEDIIVWSSLGTIKVGEGFTTGSSAIPQKVNPDVAELIRAKAGRVLGNLIKIATICKALPTAYNRDFQEIKPALIESIELVKGTISVMSRMVRAIRPDKERMAGILSDSWSSASDLVNAIAIRYEVPYRKAYLIVKGLTKGKSLERASMDVLGRSIAMSERELSDIIDPMKSIVRRKLPGGPSPVEVTKGIARRLRKLDALENWFAERSKEIGESLSTLESLVSDIVKNKGIDEESVKILKEVRAK
ncbi:TPA: hypothetical protein EYP44_03760, partial [Candidatus Bathyarchaeota archaeon]|nr:hypothetical protein [Candidatus Bathyarchaeota archaeon]